MKRDDLCLRYITMLNCIGNYDEALDMIKAAAFIHGKAEKAKSLPSTEHSHKRLYLLLLKENKAEMKPRLFYRQLSLIRKILGKASCQMYRIMKLITIWAVHIRCCMKKKKLKKLS